MATTSPPAATEEARNRALLFFMDHLMTKSGSRTIHDLSCQFGARGFSDDMRDAVGGTQETLTAFLLSYPSLFTIAGDEVSMKMYGDMAAGAPNDGAAPKTRDYEREAVDFFINKLKKFGPEMQIKSLLGHRSQAALECRMASGRHLKDFVDFLIVHVEAFVVTGDRVRLAVMPEPDDPALLVDDNGEQLTGARAKAAAVAYLKSFLESNEDTPVGLDALYAQFCQRFPHVVRQDVATNPKELLAFLKLNRQVFFIRSNKVSLVRTRSNEQSSPSSADGRMSSGADSNDMAHLSPLASMHITQPRITAVKSLKQAQIALQELLHEPLHVNGRQVVAFDCKFVSLGPTTPDFLSLLVIGAPSGRFVVFDAAHSDAIVLESGIKQLLERHNITKVMHDCANVASMLKHRYGIALTNVFDTQIAHQVHQHVRHGKALSDVRPISFKNVQRTHHPQSLMAAADNPNVPRVQVNWGQRPIGDDSLAYICEHGVALVPALYVTLHNALTPEVMPLFNKLCARRCALEEEQPFVDAMNNVAAPPPKTNVVPSHLNGNAAPYRPPHMAAAPTLNNGNGTPGCACKCAAVPSKQSIGTQTISTGEITITNVAYD